MVNLIKKTLERIRLLKIDPVYHRPRYWSNKILKEIAPNYNGDIINVSGWADEDKFGELYKDYFINAKSYSVSNLGGGKQVGSNRILEYSHNIDLNKPLEKKFYKAFDLVMTHTVLEHVYNIFQAVSNLCNMSRDSIIVIVPFAQVLHYASAYEKEGYSDYWRFTPFVLRKMFLEYNYEIVYCNATEIPASSIYYFFIFSKNPKKYLKIYGKPKDIELLPNGKDLYSIARIKILLKYLIFKQEDYYS